jgi:hypothetical protein
MRPFFILLTTIFLISCGASFDVDYDKQTDFSQFTTYQFYGDIVSGLNDLDDKRIMRAIDSSLQKRGFVKTEACRFRINFYAREQITNSRNTLGIGIGGGGGNVGVGVSGGIPIGGRIINQQLTIDFIDVSEGEELAWQVVIDGELNEKSTPQQKEAYYVAVIDKALKRFPPKK